MYLYEQAADEALDSAAEWVDDAALHSRFTVMINLACYLVKAIVCALHDIAAAIRESHTVPDGPDPSMERTSTRGRLRT